MIIYLVLFVATTTIISIVSFLASHYVEKFEVGDTTSILLGSVGYFFLAISILIFLFIAVMVALVFMLTYAY